MSDPHDRYPTRRQALVFGFKAMVLRWLRRLNNWRRPVVRYRPVFPTPQRGRLIAEVSSPLWSDGTPAERVLQLGKVENLRRAAHALDGIQVPAGAVMSFWRQVGKPSRRRGFAAGRELRQGCIIPTIGGGLCQITNGLYQAAVQAGLQIVERHAHTQVVPGSQAALGQDATVFWNYLDLRLAAPFSWRIDIVLSADALTVKIVRLGEAAGAARLQPVVVHPVRATQTVMPGSCDCCGQIACHLNIEAAHPQRPPERSAYLLDIAWPEFRAWIEGRDRSAATLLQTYDGMPSGRSNYAWPTAGWARARSHAWIARARALVLRVLAQQGAARQRAHLFFEAWFARRMAAALDPGITHLVVAQPFLPHLQRLGVLAGRRVEVLLVRTPLDRLHADLDRALCTHPDSATLGDFRADQELLTLERRALDAACTVVTPHHALASAFGARARRLDWAAPADPLPARLRAAQQPLNLAFLGPTAGRRGAWEARAALRELLAGPEYAARVHLIVIGTQLEGRDFWAGLPIEFRPARTQAFADVDLLLTPAWIDHAPRRALQCLAAGRMVVASTGCGLPPQPRLRLVPNADAAALTEALRASVAALCGMKDDDVNAARAAATDAGR